MEVVSSSTITQATVTEILGKTGKFAENMILED
jgi:hypothetical protein